MPGGVTRRDARLPAHGHRCTDDHEEPAGAVSDRSFARREKGFGAARSNPLGRQSAIGEKIRHRVDEDTGGYFGYAARGICTVGRQCAYAPPRNASVCTNAAALSATSARAIPRRTATSRHTFVASMTSATIAAPRSFDRRYHSEVSITVARLGRLSVSSRFKTCSAWPMFGLMSNAGASRQPVVVRMKP